ncbi:hypothetical protein GCM10027440_30570 [Nocardiopsis coralliicola]
MKHGPERTRFPRNRPAAAHAGARRALWPLLRNGTAAPQAAKAASGPCGDGPALAAAAWLRESAPRPCGDEPPAQPSGAASRAGIPRVQRWALAAGAVQPPGVLHPAHGGRGPVLADVALRMAGFALCTPGRTGGAMAR